MSARITKIVHIDNKGEYVNVSAQLDDGSECVIYVGGDVTTFFDERYNRIKGVVKHKKDNNKLDIDNV